MMTVVTRVSKLGSAEAVGSGARKRTRKEAEAEAEAKDSEAVNGTLSASQSAASLSHRRYKLFEL